jgi:hypothetical protein
VPASKIAGLVSCEEDCATSLLREALEHGLISPLHLRREKQGKAMVSGQSNHPLAHHPATSVKSRVTRKRENYGTGIQGVQLYDLSELMRGTANRAGVFFARPR